MVPVPTEIGSDQCGVRGFLILPPGLPVQSSKLQREGSLSPTLQVSQSTKSTQELPYLAINFAISDTIQMATFTAFRCANLVPHSFRTRNELRAAEDITTGPVPVEMAI